jgi:hypothetical protein
MTLLHNMNIKILQKCIDELLKENPSKEYVIGILETVIAMNSHDVFIPSPQQIPPNLPTGNPLPYQEERTDLETAYLRGGIAGV